MSGPRRHGWGIARPDDDPRPCDLCWFFWALYLIGLAAAVTIFWRAL